MMEENVINVQLESSSTILGDIQSSSSVSANIEGKGEPGPQGPPGLNGITYVPRIKQVNTLSPEQEASVSVDVEGNKMLFTFNIPKGQPSDMSKAIYDTNGNGNVDNADNAFSLDGLSKNDILHSFNNVDDLYGSLSRALSTFETYVENQLSGIENQLGGIENLPVGIINPFGGNNAPPGWLICDGREVSRFDYSSLFNVIGTTYGSGNDSTTFNLPDLRKRVPVGYSSNDNGYDTLGDSIGNETHSLSIDELAKHSHPNSVSSDGLHNHLMYNKWNSYGDGNTSGNGFTSPGNGWNQDGYEDNYTNNGGDHTHTVTITETGEGVPFSLLQPSLLINYIIKY